jgi:hypothetical protein
LKWVSPGITVPFSADDKSLAIVIDDTNSSAAPAIGRVRDFVRISPVFRARETTICRADKSQLLVRRPSFDYFDLTTANELVTSAAKPLVIE